jgi:glutathione S-transferase
MNILYFAPGACSFVPHVGLELVKAATGEDFEPRLVKLHKGEQKTPGYLAVNPNGQVPVLLAEGKPLTQIVFAAQKFRPILERIQEWAKKAAPFWLGAKPSFHDAYAFTLLRWGGIAGIDPKSLPSYHAYVTERVMTHPAVAAALARERVQLDTFKG